MNAFLDLSKIRLKNIDPKEIGLRWSEDLTSLHNIFTVRFIHNGKSYQETFRIPIASKFSYAKATESEAVEWLLKWDRELAPKVRTGKASDVVDAVAGSLWSDFIAKKSRLQREREERERERERERRNAALREFAKPLQLPPWVPKVSEAQSKWLSEISDIGAIKLETFAKMFGVPEPEPPAPAKPKPIIDPPKNDREFCFD